MKVRGEVRRVGGDGFGEIPNSLVVLLRFQGFAAFLVVIRALKQKQREKGGRNPHNFILEQRPGSAVNIGELTFAHYPDGV
jgi:hypothetical protein